mgnify:CR=1
MNTQNLPQTDSSESPAYFSTTISIPLSSHKIELTKEELLLNQSLQSHISEDELEKISTLDEDSTSTEQAHSEEELGKDTEDMSDDITSPADDNSSAE